jgi:hypothetical protein
MQAPFKLAVKFCGNCNPQISGGEILKEIKERAVSIVPASEFVSWESPEADVLVIISGCPVDCAARPQGRVQKIVVAGESVNSVFCDANEISTRVLDLLQSIVFGMNK